MQKQRINNRSLLVITCSKRKKQANSTMNAWEIYDGVAFRVIKKAQMEGRFPINVDILIISALYGVITPGEKINTYNQKMTMDLARENASSNCKKLETVTQTESYSEIFINAGKVYLASIQPFENWVPDDTSLIIAEGGIGEKMQQMKKWIINNN